MILFNGECLKDKKIIAICPSRGRVKKLKAMLDSFERTTSGIMGMVVCIDVDDENVGEYVDLIRDRVAYSIMPRKKTTEIFNTAFKEVRGQAEMFHMTNDDVVYETDGFDEIVWEEYKRFGHGIFFGNDGIHNEKLCTFPFISGEIARGLGWLQMPKLWYLYNDCVMHRVGEDLDCLRYFPDIMIRHNHLTADKSYADSISDVTNSKETYQHDLIQYTLWSTRVADKDIERVRLRLRLKKACL